jgi:hypothetical protein
VRQPTELSKATTRKLQELFDSASVKGGAAAVKAAQIAAFAGGELVVRLAVEDFADLIRSVTDFDAIITSSDGALEIDNLFDKLNMNGDNHVSMKEFLDMIAPNAKAEKKKDGSRKRFNTWGRKKKAKGIDQELGITVGDAANTKFTHEDADHVAGQFASKRAVFGGDVLF